MSKPKLQPLSDNIVVRRLDAEAKSRGGILLPDTAKEKPRQGVIVAVGRGRVLKSGRLSEPQVKIDDRVVFGAYAGTEVKVGKEELLILRESDVLAVLS
jgi:chaperonin GroES